MRVLQDRLVVRRLPEVEMKGGIYLPDQARERPAEGEVIAVGPGLVKDGVRTPVGVKVGERVMFGKYSGTALTIDGEEALILREDEVLAVL